MMNRPVCATLKLRLGSPLLTALLIVCALLLGACSSTTALPTSPTKFEPPPGTYRSTFTSLKGETGFAGISVTPKAIPEGTFTADISVRLVGLKANTTYLVQRAQEGVGGRPLGEDGICQRALSLSPWSSSDAAAPTFQTVPLPNTGPLITLTTAANGDGALDFEFRTLMILAGTTNDVMYRLADNDAAPTTELRTPCMMITAR
ncbi:MAG: hypothetical protein ABJA98_25120 [Acidobacteriota bacterium]